jgi:hypothetical protein
MADIAKLKDLIDAYGVGVRAGLLTPCLEDENAFRAMLGLDAAPQSVVQAWDDQGGIRIPVTLQKPGMIEETVQQQGLDASGDTSMDSDADESKATDL